MDERGQVLPPRPRVCSVPADHAYVRHLDDPANPLVQRLPDPVRPGSPTGTWWPHAALEPGWVRDHAHEFDVLHVHFGFEHRSADELTELVAVLAELRRPLVVTVHDLVNPHLVDPDAHTAHAARLRVLVRAAAQVLTLTEGAAREVRRRWGRTAHVVPHPHVAPLRHLGRARGRAPGDGPVVGLHLKDVRANLDLRILEPLHEAVVQVPGARLRTSVHRSGLRRLEAAGHPRAVRLLTSSDVVDLVVHDRWDDDELVQALRRLDVLVLPYAHGTHSGMVELCHDVGTAVVASDRGLWHEQQPVRTYRTDASGPDRASVRAALRDALHRPAPAARADDRLRQRVHLAQVHREVYERAVSGPAA